MIFKQVQQVLDGTKSQTRRPMKKGDFAVVRRTGGPVTSRVLSRNYYRVWPLGESDMPEIYRISGGASYQTALEDPAHRIMDVVRKTYSFKYRLGRTYAVQPGRGKKAVGRIRITKIRRERLQEISDEDCKAEGISRNLLYEMDYIPGHQSLGDDRYFKDEQRVAHPQGSFALLWDKIYPKQYNWLDNPECWVLDFERSE